MYEDLTRALSDPSGEYVKYTESKRSKQYGKAALLEAPKKRISKIIRNVAIVTGSVFAVIFVIWGIVMNQVQAQMLVPQVVGSHREAAVEEVDNAGFDVQVIEEHSDKPVGEVLRQTPEFGKSAPAGSQVTLYVSQGVGAQKVPNVENIPVDKAKEVLRSSGLRARIVEEPEGEFSIGYVMEQSPAAGDPVEDDTEITLKVKVSTQGYLIKVPNIVGDSVQEGVETLHDVGFSKFWLYEASDDDKNSQDVRSGEVISQTPQSETELMSSQPVSLHYEPFDFNRYKYPGEVGVHASKDQTSVQVGIVGKIGDTEVYNMVADTLVEEGTHQIKLSTVPVDSVNDTVDAELVIFVDNEPIETWEVTLEKVE